METIIVTSSRSPHSNTKRIADTLANELNATVLAPEELTADAVASAKRIGFGSGIYWMNFDQRLRDCITGLPDMKGREAFVFATSGLPETPFRSYTQRLSRLLEGRGFKVTGVFTCRGLDTMGPLGVVGGVNKDRPNESDLEKARIFARGLGRR